MTLGHLVDVAAGDMDALAAKLTSGRISPERWQRAMAKELADYHTAAYMLGTSERLNVSLATLKGLSAAERADINQAVHAQRAYLDAFTQDVTAGDLSPAQIRARARSYAGSVKATYWQALAPGLPFYPGDGCQCHTNCTCRWQARGGAWWWMMGGSIEHCDDCRRRADGSPYEAS
jgi:hypothetical protein